MRNLFISVLILLFFIMCSSSHQNEITDFNPDLFIELKDAMDVLKKNDTLAQNLSYDLSVCDLLEQYDSLHIDHKEIILTKKYKNIEALITNLDKNLMRHLGIEHLIDSKDTFNKSVIEDKIEFPVLKYKNRVLMNTSALYSSSTFIIELKEPQKAIVTLIYSYFDNIGLEIIEGSVEAEIDANGVFIIVEELPKFPNGDDALFRFLKENMRYPESAKKDGIRGKVHISFVVEKDGTIDDIKIEDGLCQSCDEEAIRVVKSMPAWIPGRHNGVNVAVRYTLPIYFGEK